MTLPTPLPPTLQGFQEFVTNVLEIPPSALPANAPVIGYAFDFALDWVNTDLCAVPGQPGAYSMYTRAVYNLAADTLINWAPDQNGLTYFAQLRKGYGINNFVGGVLQSTGDEGTNSSYAVSESLKNLTISNLQNLKTPYGRVYLGIAQSIGPTVWGLN